VFVLVNLWAVLGPQDRAAMVASICSGPWWWALILAQFIPWWPGCGARLPFMSGGEMFQRAGAVFGWSAGRLARGTPMPGRNRPSRLGLRRFLLWEETADLDTNAWRQLACCCDHAGKL